MGPPHRGQRLRKRPPLQPKRTTFLSPLILISIILFLLQCFLFKVTTTNFDSSIQASGSSQGDLLLRCQKSCSRAFNSDLTSLEDYSSPPSSSSSDILASYAVNSLFQVQRTDLNRRDDRPKGHSHRIIPDKRMQHSQESSLPRYLPPLIEQLLGEVNLRDYPYYFTMTSPFHSKYAQDPNIPWSHNNNYNYNHYNNYNNNRITTTTTTADWIKEKGINNPVSQVAAAAAAAIRSESGRNKSRSRLRLKSLNEEWDTALRWVSSLSNRSSSSSSDQQSVVDNSVYYNYWESQFSTTTPTTTTTLGKEKKSENHDSIVEHGLDDFHDDLECIKKCMSIEEGNSRANYYLDDDDSKSGVNIIETTASLISIHQVFSSIKMIFSSDSSYSSSSSSLLHENIVIKSLFWTCIYTVSIIGLRSITDWFKLSKLKSSLHHIDDDIDIFSMEKNSHIIRKKNVSKKIRKKRRDQRQNRIVDNMTKSNEHSSAPQANSTTVENLDSSDYDDDSDDSLCYENFGEFSKLKKQRLPKEGDDKSTTSSTSSYHTEDTDLASLSHSTKTAHDKVATNTKHLNSKNIVPSTQVSGKKHHQSLHQERPSQVANRRVEKKGRNGKPVTNLRNQVPTEKEREEASRRLRDFQNAQIEKLIKMKRSQTVQDSPSQNPSTSVTSSPTVILSNMKTPLRPPPGFSDVSHLDTKVVITSPVQHQVELFVGGNEDNEEYVDGFLLDILNENEDEDLSKRTAESKSDGIESFQTKVIQMNSPENQDIRNQLRSVALGDLLVGSLSPYRQSPPSSFNNPWLSSPAQVERQILECSDMQGCKDETSDCTDPNVCLQVSAKSFAPSWNVDNGSFSAW